MSYFSLENDKTGVKKEKQFREISDACQQKYSDSGFKFSKWLVNISHCLCLTLQTSSAHSTLVIIPVRCSILKLRERICVLQHSCHFVAALKLTSTSCNNLCLTSHNHLCCSFPHSWRGGSSSSFLIATSGANPQLWVGAKCDIKNDLGKNVWTVITWTDLGVLPRVGFGFGGRFKVGKVMKLCSASLFASLGPPFPFDSYFGPHAVGLHGSFRRSNPPISCQFNTDLFMAPSCLIL